LSFLALLYRGSPFHRFALRLRIPTRASSSGRSRAVGYELRAVSN
jgi:hypothetical protein